MNKGDGVDPDNIVIQLSQVAKIFVASLRQARKTVELRRIKQVAKHTNVDITNLETYRLCKELIQRL